MGMFDTIVCRFPLPHHQDATFQTKDLAAAALGERCVSGLLDEYEITAEGALRRHVHEREWTEDPEAFLGGYMRDQTGSRTEGFRVTRPPAAASRAAAARGLSIMINLKCRFIILTCGTIRGPSAVSC